uniref:hypothetical protein n=1 Tax=Streptococcus pluranimalium TaxID=82348 RepID=UPI003F68E375
MNYTDTTSLTCLAGNVLKQADHATTLSYKLKLKKGELPPEGTATVQLIADNKIAYHFESSVKDAVLSFTIDEVLPEAQYDLEVAFAGHVFPSSNTQQIVITKNVDDYVSESVLNLTKLSIADEVAKQIDVSDIVKQVKESLPETKGKAIDSESVNQAIEEYLQGDHFFDNEGYETSLSGITGDLYNRLSNLEIQILNQQDIQGISIGKLIVANNPEITECEAFLSKTGKIVSIQFLSYKGTIPTGGLVKLGSAPLNGFETIFGNLQPMPGDTCPKVFITQENVDGMLQHVMRIFNLPDDGKTNGVVYHEYVAPSGFSMNSEEIRTMIES